MPLQMLMQTVLHCKDMFTDVCVGGKYQQKDTTMVIHFKNAPMTYTTVVRSWRPRRYTLLTDRRYHRDFLRKQTHTN